MNDATHRELERLVAMTLPRLFSERLRLELARRPAPATRLDGGDRLASPLLEFDLRVDDQHRPMLVYVVGRVEQDAGTRMRRLARRVPHAVTLLVAPRIGGASRKRLRDAHVNFADLAGNVFVRAPGILIDVQGEGERPVRITHPQRVNPFSKRASLVLRTLFMAPHEPLGVTALAQRTGLAKGWVSQVVHELAVRGYVRADGAVQLMEPVAALRDWVAAYSWRKNTAHSLVLPYEYGELIRALSATLGGTSWALTLLAGAQQVARNVHYSGQVHIYVAPEAREVVLQRLREGLFAEPASANAGNLQVLLPYYGDAAFFGAQRAGELPIVSVLQLFLDLAHFPVRGVETAAVLLRGPLARQLSLSPQQVAELLEELE